jgi:hypothetical protein
MSLPVSDQQRWSARIPLSLDVALYGDGSRLCVGRMRDISLGGMFVETRFKLFVDASVVVGFGVRLTEERAYYRIPATVVRVTEHGVGLMFNRFDVDTVRSLRHSLFNLQQGHGWIANEPERRSITIQL